jgi:hypothetical protein
MVENCASFPDSFQGLVRSCSSFYKNNQKEISTEHVRQARSKLSGFARVFHEECGTLTPSVKKSLEDLKDGNCIALMTAHQPNFFPYSGVLRKATLNFLLGKKLEESLGIPVVNFFGIADQDFTDDKWVRSCQLPAVQRSEGIKSLEAKLPEKIMLNKTAKPTCDSLSEWKAEIEKWIDDATRSVNRLLGTTGLAKQFKNVSSRELHQNLESFWDMVEECYNRCGNFADFNAFLLSKIVNEVWEYNTLFSRFSENQQAFCQDFNFLLSHFGEYSNLLRQADEIRKKSNEAGVSNQESELVPFWYHCDCGGKTKLHAKIEDSFLAGEGICSNCGHQYFLKFGASNNPDMSPVASRVSLRAISMNLVFFRGLAPICYIGGAAGAGYLREAQHVAKGLSILFPPIVVWRPHDRYLGVGQIEALLELRRICDKLGVRSLSEASELLQSRILETRTVLDSYELKRRQIEEKLKESHNDQKLKEALKLNSICRTRTERSSGLSVTTHELRTLQNTANAVSLMPCVLDYAINMGLRETSNQWLKHLTENGSLISDVHMNSIVSQGTQLETLQCLTHS